MRKRILTVILSAILGVSAFGCGAPVFAAKSKPKTKDTINSGHVYTFDKYNNVDNNDTEETYVLNTKTKKIHDPDCSSVKRIAKKNYSTSSKSISELEKDGYSLCGKCLD